MTTPNKKLKGYLDLFPESVNDAQIMPVGHPKAPAGYQGIDYRKVNLMSDPRVLWVADTPALPPSGALPLDGSFYRPFQTIADAAAAVQNDGAVWRIVIAAHQWDEEVEITGKDFLWIGGIGRVLYSNTIHIDGAIQAWCSGLMGAAIVLDETMTNDAHVGYFLVDGDNLYVTAGNNANVNMFNVSDLSLDLHPEVAGVSGAMAARMDRVFLASMSVADPGNMNDSSIQLNSIQMADTSVLAGIPASLLVFGDQTATMWHRDPSNPSTGHTVEYILDYLMTQVPVSDWVVTDDAYTPAQDGSTLVFATENSFHAGSTQVFLRGAALKANVHKWEGVEASSLVPIEGTVPLFASASIVGPVEITYEASSNKLYITSAGIGSAVELTGDGQVALTDPLNPSDSIGIFVDFSELPGTDTTMDVEPNIGAGRNRIMLVECPAEQDQLIVNYIKA